MVQLCRRCWGGVSKADGGVVIYNNIKTIPHPLRGSPLSGSARDAHMGACTNLSLPLCGGCAADPGWRQSFISKPPFL